MALWGEKARKKPEIVAKVTLERNECVIKRMGGLMDGWMRCDYDEHGTDPDSALFALSRLF